MVSPEEFTEENSEELVKVFFQLLVFYLVN